MTYVKIVWEALKILPALYEEIKKLREANLVKQISEMKVQLNQLTTELKNAKTHEDRKRIASSLNKL